MGDYAWSADPMLPLTRDLLDRIAPPDRACAPFQPETASVHWQRVSGGRAVHAFAPGDRLPLCGAAPVRGTDRGPARWIDTGVVGTIYLPRHWRITGPYAMRARPAHKRCQQLAQRWADSRRRWSRDPG